MERIFQTEIIYENLRKKTIMEHSGKNDDYRED
jgi:hypothetical protein